ncbi:MAG: phosphate ABC transporter substrate-binding protein [Bacteroidetes bacterium]|nr:phosphate ABC transporter substrate-binding protein [Bacteroidota bacterium]MBU1113705.1 phosphate ABC transporter substrate-binding protein [Bacteroidota bacterium]MBU1798060.1 phosphate ABC transporter substrate-binding protein [Bacteroidota bacterium]
MKQKVNAFFAVLMLLVGGCYSSSSISEVDAIIIKGSDTMLQLTQKLADTFSENNPNTKFQIYGGGTETGIEELLSGRIDICNASRNLTPLEAKNLADYYGSIGMYYLIAKDAISIYANIESPINNLSMEELNKILTGQYSNLDSLNLGKGKIVLAIRDSDSGTRKFLQDLVLPNNEFSKTAKAFATTEEIIAFIQENKNGISFGGIGLAKGIKLISINGIEPNSKNTKNDSYPLTRYLHFFTTKSPSGKVKKFIDWVLSPEGQKVVKEEGFVPLWEINY